MWDQLEAALKDAPKPKAPAARVQAPAGRTQSFISNW
jgi:hypothetical protein